MSKVVTARPAAAPEHRPQGWLAFPWALVRNCQVPRFLLSTLRYERALALLSESAAAEDAQRCDPAAVRLLHSEPFFSGLKHANPELAGRVLKLPETAESEMNKKERQTLRAALRYLWRAAMKPTPFGGFVATGVTSLTESRSGVASDKPVRTARPSHRVLLEFARATFRHHAARQSAWLRLSPFCCVDDQQRARLWSEASGDWRFADAEIAAIVGPLPAEGICCRQIPPELLDRILREGWAELHLATLDSDSDDALRRLQWQAFAADAGILPLALQWEDYRGRLAAVTAGNSDGQSQFHIDSCHPTPLPGEAYPEAFFEEVVQFGSHLWLPGMRMEAQILRALFRYLNGRSTACRFLDFYAGVRQLRAGARSAEPVLQQLISLAYWLKLEVEDPFACFREALEDALRVAASGTVPFPVVPEKLRYDSVHARLSMRYQRAETPSHEARHHISLWGGDRMSLYPRYGRLPFAVDPPLIEQWRVWMRRWPDACDINTGFVHDADHRGLTTDRTIDLPGSAPHRGSIPIAELILHLEPEGDRLYLADRQGRIVDPVFCGASAPTRLPEMAQFLLLLAPGRCAALEAAIHAVNQSLLRCLSDFAPTGFAAFPAITLGKTILLSPRFWLMAPRKLHQFAAPVSKAEFLEFHRFLSAHQFPQRLVKVQVGNAEPLWVDLAHPEGVNNLLRLARGSLPLLLSEPLQQRPDHDQSSETEYYVELASKASSTTHQFE